MKALLGRLSARKSVLCHIGIHDFKAWKRVDSTYWYKCSRRNCDEIKRVIR